MHTPPAMITPEEPLWAVISNLISIPGRCFWVWRSEPFHPISSAGIDFCLNNYCTKVLDSKIPPCLQEFLHVAHCTQALRNHLHNYDFMAYTEWLFQVSRIGTAGWVEDLELKWTDVPDVKDICESGLLFLRRLNITLQVTYPTNYRVSTGNIWANKLPIQEPIIKSSSKWLIEAF